ncbi:hypothetical protein [Paenibacillus eucommiae]|uniref:ABC transporter permease n=1 Tax=Paenibacillus eucommiae TaxID=1355755 RepID=A0ABS4J3D9_9BACL|nr:hypothetical protein [Paenibacillus eucommiae]MBP1994323.1 hypothetical protein [Paenibacillus eucommiae]
MKTLFSLLVISFKRAILSTRFLASVCGVTLVLFLTSFGMINPLSDVLSVVKTTGGGNMILVVGILPLIPFATTFASEWEEGSASFWLVRSGVRNYAVSKVVVSAFSGTLTTFAGILLYALILLIKLPFFSTITTGDAYAPLLEAGMPVRYLLYSAAHLSLSSALFAVAALWISTYIPNRFTALAAPTVLYFALYRLTRFWDLPLYLNLGTIIEGTYHAGSPQATILFKLGTVTILCLLMGYGIVGQIRRRLQND